MRDDTEGGELNQPLPEDEIDNAISGDSEPSVDEPVDGEYPVDRLRARVNQRMGGRPPIVYVVLFAGSATLLLLLVIVWISATGNGTIERPICTQIATGDARQAILDGQVSRVTALVDQQDPLHSLTGIRLEYGDGSCREPRQGADTREDLYQILGVVELYNTFGEQRVAVDYQRQNIAPELLATATPTPTLTVPPTETPTPTPTVPATETPTPTVTPTLEPTPLPATPMPPTPDASPEPIASPPARAVEAQTSPVPASPEAIASPSLTLTPEPTPTPRP